MRLRTRTKRAEPLPGLRGTVRTDRRASALARRLGPGDVAVLDHLDLDAGTARDLARARPALVVNAAPFISGRFPNLGPQLLVEAGIALLEVDEDAARRLTEGATVRLDGSTLYDEEEELASGTLLDAAEVAARMQAARSGLSTQLESFAHNAAEHLRREEGLLLHGTGTPTLRTAMADRPVVVVSGSAETGELRGLRRYVREQRPVLVGVDAGGELMMSQGMRPDVMVVSEESLVPRGSGPEPISEKVLRRAGEVVLHTTRSGPGQGLARLERLGITGHGVASGSNTADLAVLVAHDAGARLVIPVGTPAGIEEFVDGTGQASTFLTRLRVGPRVVDAAVVPALYSGRVRRWHLLLVVLIALAALVVGVATTPVGYGWWQDLGDLVRTLVNDLVPGRLSSS